MMECFHYRQSYMMAVVFLSSLPVIPASTIISDGTFREDSSTGRNLLQAIQSCPINFENQNYTIITSQCKGPNYPASECCPALQKFACPFYEQLNDLTNDCASTMFSYITLSANYPPGLFANECQDGKEGLDCSGYLPSQPANSGGSLITHKPSSMLILAGAFVGVLFSFL